MALSVAKWLFNHSEYIHRDLIFPDCSATAVPYLITVVYFMVFCSTPLVEITRENVFENEKSFGNIKDFGL